MAKRSKPQTQIPENPSTSSKIPFRPQKILKLTTTTTKLTIQTSPEIPKILNPLTSNSEITLALNHLRSSDPKLASLIDSYTPPSFDSDRPPFQSLARSILYQQLATKAAQSIYTRFVTLCGGESSILPKTLLNLSPQTLRQIGVSGRKASYLHDLAEKFSDGTLSDSGIKEMDDESLLTMLTVVKGIGVWSVHMFMMFSLKRPDVLPVGDLGVRKGVKMLYGLKELPKPLEMEELCEKWKPYRSVGSWYMWRYMEAKGVL